MSVILALETATSSCSVALKIDGDIVVRNEVGNNVHSQVLLEMVSSLLLEANLDPRYLEAVAVGQGPGSFTGLRIGVGVGQGLAFGANCPMIGVSSLDALAMQAEGDGTVLAAIDARMGEVYWCQYLKKGRKINRLGQLQVTPPRGVSTDGADVAMVGNAWNAYPGQFSALNAQNFVVQDSAIYPCAGALLEVAEGKYSKGKWVTASEFAPIYVRDDVAKKSTKKLPGNRPPL